ncbi:MULTISPECIES: hypothetical protein [unclassified Curtobacterium]|uniref:hypothetical protein n=1 Tax=unclassified Curtobacterium TaxID=257496 RepID=UPI000825283C|nr:MULTISPECIES: hypothetical protein [unclassified Curtobacterium]WIA97103.1 hypothetical protein QOL16_01555 [Curtobacterium sp. MCBA15_004]WIB00431.1 hypothetical protein QOL15_01695 [Curtobacterium sp. MCBA15_012]
MDHDTNDVPDGSTPQAAPPTGGAAPGIDAAVVAFCTSVFDRWRCGEPDGHGGSHRAASGASTASWNESATGRALRGWAARTMRGPRAGVTDDE